MKICILTHTFPRNDQDTAAAFMKELCDGLVENGQQVVVVTPYDPLFSRNGDLFKIFTYKYIWPEKLHLLGYSRTMEADIALRKRAYFIIPFLLFFGFLALLKVVKKEKIDIISVHWIIPNGLIAMLVSKLTKVPFTVTLPGTDAYLAYKNKLFGKVAKVIADNSAAIFSNSSLHLNRILGLGVKKPKFQDIISYPVNTSSYYPSKKGLDEIRNRHNLDRTNITILAIGRMVYKKGFDFLIRAMPTIFKKYPHVRLLFGGEGDLKSTLENLAKDLKISDKVLFMGNLKRDEIFYYYNLADIMVAPSIIDEQGNVDGGPVVSFESMACGKPQVVTNILGVADIMKDGINGFIVEQKNSKALGLALKKLIESKPLREKMGEANRKLIRSELTTKKIGQRYINFFNKVLARRA